MMSSESLGSDSSAAIVKRLIDAGTEALRQSAFVDPDDGTMPQFHATDQWPNPNVRHWTTPDRVVAPVVVAVLRELGKSAMALRPASAEPFVMAEDVRTWLTDAATQVLALHPSSEKAARHLDPEPGWDVVEVLARILDPGAFDPASDVGEDQRPERQSTARTMARRAIEARYERRSGFTGCGCGSCLRGTGRCPRCGRHDPVDAADETSLCATCEFAMSRGERGFAV